MGKDQKKKNKNKKTKVIYIDDGSSLADMSGVSGGSRRAPRTSGRPHAPFRDQWRTYTDAVKMMFLPMLAVLGVIALAFLIIYIIL